MIVFKQMLCCVGGLSRSAQNFLHFLNYVQCIRKNIYWVLNWNNLMLLQLFDREISASWSETTSIYNIFLLFCSWNKNKSCKPLKSIKYLTTLYINSRTRYFSDYIWLKLKLGLSISQKIRKLSSSHQYKQGNVHQWIYRLFIN